CGSQQPPTIMQVWVQGCPTLYKSQVVLSIKDTPLVPKLCIKSEHDGVLDRAPVVLLPAAHLFESVRRVQCACRRVGFANLEVDLSGPPTAQHVEHPFHEGPSQPPTTALRRHRQVQDLALIGRVDRDDIPG